MKSAFLILAGADVLLLGVTALAGFSVAGSEGFSRHFLLGLLAVLYTIFVHLVVFVYFMVSVRVVCQAIEQGAAQATGAATIQAGKSRAFRLVMTGVLYGIATAALGGLVTEPGQAAAWGLSTGWHQFAGMGMLPLNLLLFAGEYREIGRNAAWLGANLEA